MPMWGGYWSAPWGGIGWVFPLLGLVFMVVMAIACFRMMGSCMARQGHHADGAIEDLRREVRDLREEVRTLREQRLG